MSMHAKAMKGQSAMEYLMTYGWAILIVVIVAAVLFSLGVFNPSTFTQTTATGFSGFNVPSGGFQLTSGGTMSIRLTNGVGATISITNVGVKVGSTHNSSAQLNGLLLPQTVGPGQTVTITHTGLGTRTTGSAYTATGNVTYTNSDTGLAGFISSGTLTGTVS